LHDVVKKEKEEGGEPMEKPAPGEEESKTAATAATDAAAAPRVSFVHEESKEERVMRLCNPTAAAADDGIVIATLSLKGRHT
jgi:hypothetical protein